MNKLCLACQKEPSHPRTGLCLVCSTTQAVCRVCKTLKGTNNFSHLKTRICYPCRTEQQKQWNRKNSKPCIDCNGPKLSVVSLRCRKCASDSQRKGVSKNSRGYLTVPNPNGKGRVLVHRQIVEQDLGRKLLKTEVVIHLDGNKQNNTLPNLMVVGHKDCLYELVRNASAHIALWKEKGSPNMGCKGKKRPK